MPYSKPCGSSTTESRVTRKVSLGDRASKVALRCFWKPTLDDYLLGLITFTVPPKRISSSLVA